MAASNLEILLQMIAQAAPGSWYPRVYCERSGIPLPAVHYYLEFLYLDGLITSGSGDAKTGPGVTLTAKGAQLLQDPEAMQRLRQGKAIDPTDRGGRVREILGRSVRPIVTWVLIGLNVAVFAGGFLLSRYYKISGFIGGFLDVGKDVPIILELTGSLIPHDLIRGEWWRLLTNCFVHIGLIHLLANMWVLRSLGGYTEQMWGRWRYLAIYLLAGVGGSCLQMAIQPRVLLAGASGAICGLISAEVVWVLLNWRYLPRSFVRRWRGNFQINLLLLVGISLVPGISGLGHLGGALTGAAAALLLHWQRFGPNPWRWLGVVALIPLPWLGYAGIEYARRTNPAWIELEPRRAPSPANERP